MQVGAVVELAILHMLLEIWHTRRQLISSICGIDGTAAFSSQHGSSAKPNNALAGLLLGSLGAEIAK